MRIKPHLLMMVLSSTFAEDLQVPDPFGLGQRLAIISALKDAKVPVDINASDQELDDAYRTLSMPLQEKEQIAKKYGLGFITRLSPQEAKALAELIETVKSKAQAASESEALRMAKAEYAEKTLELETGLQKAMDELNHAKKQLLSQQIIAKEKENILQSELAAVKRLLAAKESELNAPSSENPMPKPAPTSSKSPATSLTQRIIATAKERGVEITESQAREVEVYANDANRIHGIAKNDAVAGYLTLRVNTKDPHTHVDALLNLEAVLRSLTGK